MLNKVMKKLIASLAIAAMVVPMFSMTARAEEIRVPGFVDSAGRETFEVSNGKIVTTAEERELDQLRAIDRVERAKAVEGQTGYYLIKIPAAEFLSQYGAMYGLCSFQEGTAFDSTKYAELNPDVAAVVGNDHTALWNHYKTVGVFEGRKTGYISTRNTTLLGRSLEYLEYMESVCTPNTTDREKVIYTNNWICAHTYYTLNWNKDTFYNSNGEKAGKCTTYAMEFENYMHLLGIPCITDMSPSHEWNRVYVDGKWYVVDVTWNDTLNTNAYLFLDRHPNQVDDGMVRDTWTEYGEPYWY